MKIWAFAVQAGSLSAHKSPFPGVTCPGIRFSKLNLLVNNPIYYSSGINSPYELYLMLQDQMNNSNTGKRQALISYTDFLQSYHYLCFELSRFQFLGLNSKTNLMFTSCCYYKGSWD